MSYKIKKDGEWVTVANGSRMFVGSTAAIDAAIARGELKYPDLYADTSDWADSEPYVGIYSLPSGKTTSTTSWTDFGSVSITVPSDGTYELDFRYWIQVDNQAYQAQIAYKIGGGAQKDLFSIGGQAISGAIQYCISAVATLTAGSHTIQLYGKVASEGAKTMTVAAACNQRLIVRGIGK